MRAHTSSNPLSLIPNRRVPHGTPHGRAPEDEPGVLRGSLLVVALAGALLLAGTLVATAARSSTDYDAALGSLPEDQGWTRGEQIIPLMGYPVGVSAGELHLSTLGFAASGETGGGVWWERGDLGIDFSADFSVEVSVRIADAPNHSVNPTTGWPRPGYALVAYDVHGRIFWIGLGAGEVFLSNTSFGQYGSPNTVHTAFNTTDAQHTYRIERAAGGVGAALRIDGVTRLELPVLGGAEGTVPLVYFGDPTFWANSESFTSRVRSTTGTVGVESSSRAAPLWAKPLGSPASRLRFAYRAGEGGALVFEVFDAAGRRISRSEQEVAANQGGSFEAAGAHRDGLYFYRLRLSTVSGGVSEVSGRVVLVQ